MRVFLSFTVHVGGSQDKKSDFFLLSMTKLQKVEEGLQKPRLRQSARPQTRPSEWRRTPRQVLLALFTIFLLSFFFHLLLVPAIRHKSNEHLYIYMYMYIFNIDGHSSCCLYPSTKKKVRGGGDAAVGRLNRSRGQGKIEKKRGKKISLTRQGPRSKDL